MEQHAPAVSVSEGDFADRVHAAFAAIAIDRSFTDKQQQFLNRLAKFAIQTHTTVDLIHTAFEESRLFKNTYGGVKWLSKNLFAGRVQSLERELNAALEKQFTQAIHVQEQELPTQSDTHEQQIETEKQSNKQSSPTVDDLAVGDIILYDGKRREVEQIDENRISLKDLDAPDFGVILLGTSDVYAYNGWQDDMNAKGFEILSKAEPAAKTEPEPKKEQPAIGERLQETLHYSLVSDTTVLNAKAFTDFAYTVVRDDQTVRNAHENSDKQEYRTEVRAAVDGLVTDLITGEQKMEDYTVSDIADFTNDFHANETLRNQIYDSISERVDTALTGLEETRRNAQELGMPFSDQFSSGIDDEFNPYVYDGSMSPDDFEKVQQTALEVDTNSNFPEQQPSQSGTHPIDTEILSVPESSPNDRNSAASILKKQDFHITDAALGIGGAKTKFRANVTAIETLKRIEQENRMATPEEQKILSNYVGWGGLPQAFDANNAAWAKEFAELQTLLSTKEYTSAKGSVLNAHYTAPAVIDAMYEVLQNNGLGGGKILEPAMGTGHFFGKMPDEIRKHAQLTGIELDDISGRIAKQLYQSAHIQITGFERTNFPDDSFDLAVGNVPFGGYSLHEKRYDKQHFLIHDHFFAKSLDKIKPGGIVAFVTSKGTLDKKNPDVRKYLAERAELVGAIRLPNDAFKANAGTEVTTDIVFLQKRENPLELTPETTPDWVHLGQTEDGLPINAYFAEHPEMVLGQIVPGNKLYGNTENDTMCIPMEGASLKELLHQAAGNIHFDFHPHAKEHQTKDTPLEIVEIPLGLKDNSFAVIHDRLYYRNGDVMQPFKPETGKRKIPQQEQRIRGMVEIRDCMRELFAAQIDGAEDETITALQAQLRTLYDAFTESFGYIHDEKNRQAFKTDSAAFLLESLEEVKEGKVIGKAAVFTKRTIKPNTEVTSAESAVEALSISLRVKAVVDLAYMQQLTGIEPEKLLADLQGVVYANPMHPDTDGNPRLETADEFLSGNIREKLNYMRQHHANDPRYTQHIAALEQAMPEQKRFEDADIRLGMRCVSPEIVTKFMHDTFRTPSYFANHVKAEYFTTSQTSGWEITGKGMDRNNRTANTLFGTKRMDAYTLLENILNRRQLKITDPVERDGKVTYILNEKETELVNDQKRALEDAFQEWLLANPEMRDAVMEQYNIAYSSKRPRTYDGAHLEFPGMNTEITLRKHQRDAIARALYGGNTLFAHEVGAGKTFSMIASIMEGKRLGLHNKSLLCVPNHLTEQIGADFLKLYPNVNILVATADDFKKQNRQRLFAKIATGEYDAVIIGHSQLKKIPVSQERQERILQEQIDSIIEQLQSAKAQSGNRLSVKKLEQSKKSLETKLHKLTDAPIRDDIVTFEEMGIDQLVLDEAHEFKNLFIATKMGNIGGLATNDNVQKTVDLLLKCRYIDEITNGTGLIFSTGTPVSNQLAELYVFMVYLQENLLEELGIEHFDDFAAEFLEVLTESQINVEGTGFQTVTRIAGYNNADKLTELWRESTDIVTADMMHLPTPACTVETIVAKPTETQKQTMLALADLALQVRNKQVDKKTANMLSITSVGRKNGLDQRLLNPDLPDEPGTKVNLCVDNVFRIWDETTEQRSTQLIFCDLGVPQSEADKKKNGNRHSVYADIKQKLIAKGIPSEEIAFIHDAKNEAEKDKLFAKVRRGEIRVLIGSTQKMGAGTNVQDKLIASHDLDAPWKPSDLEQRRGRMVRQGNENPHVHLYRYVTEGTFDAYIFQALEKKQKGISQIMTGESTAHQCEAMDEVTLSYAEVKALATGNPEIKEKMELEIDVPKLQRSKKAHLTKQSELKHHVAVALPAQIAALTTRIESLEKDISMFTSKQPDGKDTFPGMQIEGRSFAEKGDAGKALLAALQNTVLHGKGKSVEIGQYQGFSISAEFDVFSHRYVVHLQGHGVYHGELGGSELGNLTRLDNILNGMPSELETAKAQLTSVREQLKESEGLLEIPFPREQELREKEARLAELTKKFAEEGQQEPTVEITEPFIIELGSQAQLDKLKASGIPYKKAETTDGKLIVRVNLKDKAAAQNAIRNNQTGLKL